MCVLQRTLIRVPTAQVKQGKWQNRVPVMEKTGNLEILPKHRENTGNLVCSSFKFPGSKCKRYFDFCHKISTKKMFFLSWISLRRQFCVCNRHKSRKLAQRKFAVVQGKHREFENEI